MFDLDIFLEEDNKPTGDLVKSYPTCPNPIFEWNLKYFFRTGEWEYIRDIIKIWNNIKNTPEYWAYQYKVSDKEELEKIINCFVNIAPNADLNWIDVSVITDMSFLFLNSKYNGDISQWNVSNVLNMFGMFANSEFNGNLSKWDVSNVLDMRYMFYKSKFSQDISSWKINTIKTHHML